MEVEAYMRIRDLDERLKPHLDDSRLMTPRVAIVLGLRVGLAIAQVLNELVGVLADIERNQRR